MVTYTHFRPLFSNSSVQMWMAKKLSYLYAKKIIYNNSILIKHNDNAYSRLDIVHGHPKRACFIALDQGDDFTSYYIKYLCNKIDTKKFTIIVYTKRCHFHESKCKKYPNHYLESDLDDIFEKLTSIGFLSFYGIGIGLGGNTILKYAACKLNAFTKIVVIGPQLDILHHRAKNVDNMKLQKRNIKTIMNKIVCYIKPFNQDVYNELLKIKQITELEETLLGVTDIHKYYMEQSSFFNLHNIKTPTLCINLANNPDPHISLSTCINIEKSNENINIIIINNAKNLALLNNKYKYELEKYINDFFE